MSFEDALKSSIEEVLKKVLPQSSIPEFYTPKQISELLNNIDEVTVRRWCRSGELSYYKFGKFIRISPKDFETFCTKNRISY